MSSSFSASPTGLLINPYALLAHNIRCNVRWDCTNVPEDDIRGSNVPPGDGADPAMFRNARAQNSGILTKTGL
jgi:hypothetical protein